ncbi:cold shock domain-containing protein [Paracoccus sp. Z118]|nr:cold shock domain-containing protein [Paracoccus sp. Z118]
MEDPSIHACVVSGYVKWFDSQRGFGFLVDDAGGQDVLIHGNVVRKFGQGTVAEGTRVEVEAVTTDRGRQATRILSVGPAAEASAPPIADLCNVSPDELLKLPVLPARVKWFDRAKGFGFANIFGRREDVFLHIEVVRHSGFADLVQGEAVGMRVVDGRRGLMAAQLLGWDRVGEAADEGGSGTGGSGGPQPARHGPQPRLSPEIENLDLPDDWNSRARRNGSADTLRIPRPFVLAANG